MTQEEIAIGGLRLQLPFKRGVETVDQVSARPHSMTFLRAQTSAMRFCEMSRGRNGC